MMVKEYPIKIEYRDVIWITWDEYRKYEGRLIEAIRCVPDDIYRLNKKTKYRIKGIIKVMENYPPIIWQTRSIPFIVNVTLRFNVLSKTEEILFKLRNNL